MIELTRSEAMKNGISVRLDLADGLPPVLGDRVQLQQVMLNLVVNAIESMNSASDGPRELLIATGEEALDDRSCRGARLRTGFAQPPLDRLFDAFHTQSPAVWAWGSRSLVRSSKRMAGGCGQTQMRLAEPSFNLLFPQTGEASRCPPRQPPERR